MDSSTSIYQEPVSPGIDTEEDYDESLGPLTPLFSHHPPPNTSPGLQRSSSLNSSMMHRSSSLTAFSGVHSFTTEDLTIPPQEATGMEFTNVAGQIQMVKVSAKGNSTGNNGMEDFLVGDGMGLEKRDLNGEQNGLVEISDEEELEVKKYRPGSGVKAKVGAEICANGELYTLHDDGIFRPKGLLISTKDQFKGYAIRSTNGIFKLLGGSPASIDISTLYRVTPTGKYFTTSSDIESKAFHRIKPVQQLLECGTSGSEENMYAYDTEIQGFVRTDITRKFPAEKALQFHEDLRNSVTSDDGEGPFAPAKTPLRKAENTETTKNKRKVPAITTQVAPMPFQPNASSPLAGPSIDFPQNPSPAKLARQVSYNSMSTTGGHGQSSWLNIDLPLQRRGLPAPPIQPSAAPMPKEGEDGLPPVPTIPEAAHYPGSSSPILPNGAANVSITSSIGQWSTRFSPRNTVNRILAAGRSRTPQHADLYAPVTLQQLVNECVLVLCVYSNRKSRDPRIARLILPNIVSADFDDMDLFLQMRARYNSLRGFWRRTLSLRGLRRIAVVEYHRSNRHVSSTFQGANYSPTKLLECYMHPYNCSGERYWVEWAHRLSLDEDRYALEFVEEWRSDKVILAAVIPLSLSITAGVIWSLYGPDQNHLVAFVLAILVIVLGWSIVALMAVVSYLV